MGLRDRIAAGTAAFIAGLGPELRDLAMLPFDETTRRTWAYWPMARHGVPISALDRRQTKAAFRLLAELLTPPAFARALEIVALEEVLDRLEDYREDRRHLGDYWLAVFGAPGAEVWGLRFEGHHLSVNVALVGAEVSMTPMFLGANPAVVRDGRHVVSAPLRAEETLGFELLEALTVEQRSSAVIADRAPDDILTRNRPRLDGPLGPAGVPLDGLTGRARSLAAELVDLYLGRFPAAEARPPAVDLGFAWAGAQEPGIGHYYRISGPRLLVELDNTQNGANHVHTVVRDPAGDFGTDVLAAHYARHHPQ